MKKIIIIFVFTIPVFAQAQEPLFKKEYKPQLIAGKNQLISFKYPLLPLVEPHLAVNPQNNKHMVAAAIVFDSAATSESRTHIAVFATKDKSFP